MRVAIYARVSKDRGEQNPAIQVEALLKWIRERGHEPARVFVDHVTGSLRERPELDALLAEVEAHAFDAVAVVKLDRLARSTRHLLDLAAHFEAHGVDLMVKDQPVDTTTPAGRLMFAVLGAVAEFERDLIRERTKAGLEHARNNGRVLGRPRSTSRALDHAVAAVAGGTDAGTAAAIHHVSESTLRRRLRRERNG